MNDATAPALGRVAKNTLGIVRDRHGVVHAYANLGSLDTFHPRMRAGISPVEITVTELPNFVPLDDAFATFCMVSFASADWVDVDAPVTCIQCLYRGSFPLRADDP